MEPRSLQCSLLLRYGASPATPISMRLLGLKSRSREIQSPDRERSHVGGFSRGVVEVAAPCAVLQTAR
jgi:hypothetical protein